MYRVDPAGLQRSSRKLFALADRLDDLARVGSFDVSGLPPSSAGAVQAELRAAGRRLGDSANRIRVGASLLAARARLAQAADRTPGFASRLGVLESASADAVMTLLTQHAEMELESGAAYWRKVAGEVRGDDVWARTKVPKGKKKKLRLAIEEGRAGTEYRIGEHGDIELRRYKPTAETPQSTEALARARRWELAAKGIRLPVADAALAGGFQWWEDRHKELSAADRVGRVAVTSATGAGAAVATVATCAAAGSIVPLFGTFAGAVSCTIVVGVSSSMAADRFVAQPLNDRLFGEDD